MSIVENSRNVEYTKVDTKENEKEKEESEIPLTYGLGVRHVQLVIFFLCVVTSFIGRGHLGVTIVAMTSHQNAKLIEKEVFNVSINCTDINDFNCTKLDRNGTSDNSTEGTWTIYKTYDWPKPIQDTVLTAFFLGYCVMMFPIALVCQRWGGKVPLQLSLFVNGIVSILTPWLALWGGWRAVCVCRVLQGMSQSGTFPGTQTLLSQWVPAAEKATLASYVYSGTTIGTVIAFQVSGILSASTYGWPSAFWTVGVLCLLTFTFLTIFGASSPRVHKKISQREKNYILGHCNTTVVQKKRVPWKAILTSKPVWGSFLTQVGSGVSFIFFFTQVPTYIHYILGIDVKSSGLLSSLPYVASFFTSIVFGVVSDYCTNRNIVSIINARRISNSISQVGLALSLVCASYANSIAGAVTCLVFAMSCFMGIHTGWMVNHIDLSPNFSGTMIALGNTLMNAGAMVLPVLVSNIVLDVRNPYQWRIMMYLVAGIALIPNLIFVFLISADVQPWNEGYQPDSEKNDAELSNKKEAEN